MSAYSEELSAALRQGHEAFEAMEKWLSRPLDAPGASGAVLEGHAKQLRESRAKLRALVAAHGERPDLTLALAQNEDYHRRLGLSMPDKPATEEEDVWS